VQAKRILHHNAHLPGPSNSLIRTSAKASYLAFATNMQVRFDADFTDWKDLKDGYQDVWEQVARSVYAVIAIEGGAIIEPIKGLPKDGGPKRDENG
jgi:hypothetical protein